MTRDPVVLFDGTCNLCNASVSFVIARDSAARFRFASLQSEYGRSVLARFGADERPDSMLLLDDDELYRESTAALRVARGLRRPWPLLYALIVVPRPLRDLVYRFIARNRHRWFGRTETCRVPTAEEASRFLE